MALRTPESMSRAGTDPTGRRHGWRVVITYSLVCAASQLLWLTYATITTESSHYYRVSVGTIGWLAEIFPLLYVALAVPAGSLLDSRFRVSLSAGGGLVAVGALVRLGGHSFAWAMAGQTLVAVAQPTVLSGVGKLAGEYLPREARANGIAVGSAGSFAGMLIALLLGPTLGAHGHIQRLLEVEAVLAILPAVALAVALRRQGRQEGQHAAIEGSAALALARMRSMRTLFGLAFVGFGVFVALATWLQQLLEPSGVSETQAGLLLAVMIVGGLVGCAVLPDRVSRRNRERRFMQVAVLVACAGCVLLGLVPGIAIDGLVLVGMGAVLLPALPVILTDAERIAGAAAGTAGALVWMAGNLGGLVVALVVQVLVHHPAAAFLAIAAVSLIGIPVAARVATPGARRPAHPPM
jgi:predicted MFS family arabinose efflux permease